MTAFADNTNIRAFRLVAAALNAPVAQPAWTEALLTSLTPSLPLVDWNPLDAWSQPESVTAVPAAPPRTKAQMTQLSEAVDGGDRIRPAQSMRPLSKVSNDDQLTEGFSNPARDRSPIPPIAATTSVPVRDPTVPSRPQNHAVGPNPATAPTPPLDLPAAWTTVPPGAVVRRSTMTEIGRLTNEILSSTPAADERSGQRSHSPLPPQPSAAAKPTAIAPRHSTPAPIIAAPIASPAPAACSPAAPLLPGSLARSLDLAGLVALYADAPQDLSDAPSFLSPPLPSPASPFPTHLPTNSAQAHPVDPSTHPPIHPSLFSLSPNRPNPSETEVAETLTDMVSAILQAQAQRHGVDLS